MGYRDYPLCLSASQAVTADTNSTYYLDFETTNPFLDGHPMAVVITVEAVTTAATGMTVELCHKASEPTTGDACIARFTFLAAAMTKGATLICPLPQGPTWLRYFRIYYDITGGSESYTFSAYLTPDPRV
jgi:hypothetical protein